MEDKKDKNEEVEVLGLDDEETPNEPSKLEKLKKYKLPGLIGSGAILLMAVFYFSFLSGDSKPEKAEEPIEHSEEHARADKSKVVDKSDVKEETSAKWKDDNVVDIAEEGEAPHRLVFIDPVAMEKSKKAKKSVEQKVDTIRLTMEDFGQYEIDTAEIMSGLEFIFTTPQKEAALVGMSVQDSVDTLNWIEKKMAELDREDKEIEKKRKSLTDLEYKVDQGMIKINQAESSRIIKLARLYDGMKAGDVSKLFSNLPDDIVVSILPRMKLGNAGKIMALMSPKRAARISTQMITVLEDN